MNRDKVIITKNSYFLPNSNMKMVILTLIKNMKEIKVLRKYSSHFHRIILPKQETNFFPSENQTFSVEQKHLSKTLQAYYSAKNHSGGSLKKSTHFRAAN